MNSATITERDVVEGVRRATDGCGGPVPSCPALTGVAFTPATAVGEVPIVPSGLGDGHRVPSAAFGGSWQVETSFSDP